MEGAKGGRNVCARLLTGAQPSENRYPLFLCERTAVAPHGASCRLPLYKVPPLKKKTELPHLDAVVRVDQQVWGLEIPARQ